MKKTMPHQKLHYSKLLPILFLEIFFGLTFACIAFLIFFELTHRIAGDTVLFYDVSLMKFIYSLRSPILTHFMVLVSFLGGSTFLLITSTTALLYLLRKKYFHDAALFGFTFVTGVLLNLLLKHVIARARPDIEPLIHEIFYSFPSGHSMNAFVFYSLLAYLTYHFTKDRFLTGVVSVICTGIILFIGISRVYLGVHYPSDVLAGYLAGAGWFLTVLVIDRTIVAYRYSRERRK